MKRGSLKSRDRFNSCSCVPTVFSKHSAEVQQSRNKRAKLTEQTIEGVEKRDDSCSNQQIYGAIDKAITEKDEARDDTSSPGTDEIQQQANI